jgi:alpha-glucosidase (family GH31 glycosyl hydrolase)
MPFEDRRDRKLRDLWDQYMFGPDLMVAPVWRVGERSREVYFPRGTWRSYWDASQIYRGRRRVTVQVPLDTIAVFVLDGQGRGSCRRGQGMPPDGHERHILRA